jgi:hypothetical protein
LEGRCQGTLQEGEFNLEGMLAVAGDGGQAKAEAVLEFGIQGCKRILIYRHQAKRGEIGFVGRGEQRFIVGLVHGGDHRDQVGGLAADGGKGITGDGSRIHVAGMRSNDGNDFAGQFGQFGAVEVGIYGARQCLRIAFIPGSGNRRRTD